MRTAKETRGLSRVEWGAVAWALLVCGAAILVYQSSLRFYFSQDDFVFLARATGVGSWRDLFRESTRQDHFYRPFPRVIMFLVQLWLFGPNAAAFHLVSLGIHALNAMLVYLLLRRFSPWPSFSGIAGVLYAVHPIPFVAVYWVSGLQDLCATLFVLLSLHTYVRWRESGPGALMWALSMLAYGLALLSKEMAVTFPLLLVLVEAISALDPARPFRPWDVARRVSGHAVLVGLFLVARLWLANLQIPQNGPYAWDLAASTGLRNASSYLADALYVRDWVDPSSWWGRGFCVAVLAITVAYAARQPVARPTLLLGSGWFVITLLPLLPMADRAYSFYAYLPLVGVAIVLATLVTGCGRYLHGWAARLAGPKRALMHAVELAGVAALALGWLQFSVAQVQRTERKDPLGILAKSVLAQQAISEVKALYPELPAQSTLYVVGVTERDAWAFGHGDLFRLYYPSANIVLAEKQEPAMALAAGDAYLYRFRDPTE